MNCDRSILPLFLMVFFINRAESCEPFKLPKHSAEEALLKVKQLAIERNLDTEGKKVTEVVYIKEQCSWLVIYKSDSLAIGDGGFGIFLPEDSGEIGLQKGL